MEVSEQDRFWIHLMLDNITYKEFMSMMGEYMDTFKTFYFIAEDLLTTMLRKMPRQRAEIATVKAVRKIITEKMDPHTKSVLRATTIDRTAPFYINMTKNAPDIIVGRQGTPTTYLERGVPPWLLEPIMKKLYDPELVNEILKRIAEDPRKGVGKVWKVMLGRRTSGYWQVTVLEITPQEFEEYLKSKKR